MKDLRDLRVLREWDEYMRMIAWLENHPSNAPGSDKSHVERADREYREHYRKAKRIR